MVFKSIFLKYMLMVPQGEGAHSHEAFESSINFNMWFGLLEIPFLILVIVLSFMVSSSLKGGKFGSGMKFIAWGFLVMAIGHIHMQLDHLTGINLFEDIFGPKVGSTIWFAALLLTWTLSGIGFYRIYKASRI